MIPPLEFALTESKHPWAGGVMQLILPYKSLLSSQPIYLAITQFPEKKGVLEPLERPVSSSGRPSSLASIYGQQRETLLPMDWWKLLFSGVTCLEGGSIPVSRVWVPYTGATLYEHTSHSGIVAGLCAQTFPSSAINPSLAYLMSLWEHFSVSFLEWFYGSKEGQRWWGSVATGPK